MAAVAFFDHTGGPEVFPDMGHHTVAGALGGGPFGGLKYLSASSAIARAVTEIKSDIIGSLFHSDFSCFGILWKQFSQLFKPGIHLCCNPAFKVTVDNLLKLRWYDCF